MSQTTSWTETLFKHACLFTSKPKGFKLSKEIDVPFVPMELIPERILYSSGYLLKNPDSLTSGTYFEDGDVLLAKITPCFENGKQTILCNLPQPFGFATTEVIPFRERTGVSDKEFLFFCLLRHDVRASLAAKMEGTTGRQRLNKNSLENLPIVLPSIREQRAIAQVLKAILKAKDTRQRELALERERKAALTEHLFTHGTRGEPTKQSEIGEIPENWRMVEVEAIAEVGNGSTPSRTDERYWKGGTIPWITSTKVHDVVIRESDEFVTETARSECHLPVVPQLSIVVAITGQGKTLGNAAILEFDTCINQHLAYLRITDQSVQPYFALFYLRSRYQYFRGVSAGGGSTKGALTCGFLKRVKIPVPPRDEQERIAELLSACEMKCGSLEKEIALLNELFNAALDELMNGRLDANVLVDGGSNQ